GYPDPDGFWTALEDLDKSGADIVEIGLPFSDPVADGPVVARAGIEAAGRGANLKWLLAGLAGVKISAPLVLMSYANPLLQHAWFGTDPEAPLAARVGASLEAMARDLKNGGFSGLIVPDVPLEESAPYVGALGLAGLDYVPLVGPNTDPGRMARYAPLAGGYVYVVSVLGTTGVRDRLPPEVGRTLGRAGEAFRLPLALGFGLREPSQLEGLDPRPDAVIFGSALLQHLAAEGNCRRFLDPWK
ncbi:MAG: tryptophan synthase subunit alpha, partial [Deltaproteobacteria bacterium]|nr:tryptophan synthase subunit alpha [Deltaproteobacteria bacterium]